MLKARDFFSRFILGMSVLQGPWEALPIPGAPVATLETRSPASLGFDLRSNGSIGSYIHVLANKISLSTPNSLLARFEWNISAYPNTQPKIPFDKPNDDYPIRLGFVFRHTSESMSLPWMMREKIKQRVGSINRVVYYAASKGEASSQACGPSPYNSRFLVCLRAGEKPVHNVRPFTDLETGFALSKEQAKEHQLVALWLIFDSDNSKSRSDAKLKTLEFIEDGDEQKTHAKSDHTHQPRSPE